MRARSVKEPFKYVIRIISLLIGFLSFSISPLWAQLDPNKLTHYEELKGTTIYDVMPDRQGNIWITSINGLIKYDGYEYKRFYPDLNDSTTMGSLLNYTLYEDQMGNIFIGGLSSIHVYDPETELFRRLDFTHLVDFPEYSMVAALTFAPDDKGRVYIGAHPFEWTDGRHGLIYYDYEDEQLHQFKLPDDVELNGVHAMTKDPAGNIWLISRSGLFAIDTMQKIRQIDAVIELGLEENDWINGLTADARGVIWFTTAQSFIYAFDPGSGEYKKWPIPQFLKRNVLEDFIITMEFGPDGNLWIGSLQGIIQFNPNSSAFEVFEDNINHAQADVNNFRFDSFHNLWIATESDGLLKYSDRPVFHSLEGKPNDKSTLTTGWINLIFETADKSIWMTSSYGRTRAGYNRFNQDSMTFEPVEYGDLLPDIQWKHINGEWEPNKILLKTNEGLIMYDIIEEVMMPYKNEELEEAGINRLFRDGRGFTWCCTENGLYRYELANKELRRYDLSVFKDANAASNHVTDCRKSGEAGLWICTNNGLFRYEYASAEITRHAFDKEQGEVLSGQDINSVYEDDKGIVWVGTWEQGLCRYDPQNKTVKTYTHAHGLPSVSVQGILGDDENNVLWLSTFSGISSFQKKSERFVNYSIKDGVNSQLFSDAAYYKSSQGWFMFGGESGVTYFKPEDITRYSVPPRVFITDFSIGDQSINFRKALSYKDNEAIVLFHDQNNISFAYTGIQYDSPKHNSFECILENYEEKWRKTGNVRSTYYYNLPPGEYVFRVRAANSHGVWNEEGASISFTIKPPWWRTIWAFIGYGLLFVLLIFSIDRVQRRRLLQKERRQAKEKELKQAKEIEKAYHQLKTTQTQLVHSEKMASLGELTAGIAHEIQNPLNFVNNFSEVNSELLDELQEELDKGDVEEAKVIAKDLKDNEEKIVHHGKRADGIVKGMLQHSRTGNGKKVPTDLNKMAEEYIRLSYHGLRAKDKSFNAEFNTELYDSLPKVNVVPQDIGRVLLNLINNAFYAVSERAKRNAVDYQPKVSVVTSMDNGTVVIRVIDNGLGIPADMKGKIFQPFFTTKQAGEGTGLGLSLSYDIITKGHGGELELKSTEGEGTEFIIRLIK